MSRSYWLPIVALGGFLATTALGQTPNAQGVSQPAPPVASQSTQAADKKPQRPEDTALPIIIIQDPADASHAQDREAKSDKHDDDDLRAQIRAADAAEKQVSPAWAAVAITLLGTMFVYWNLREVRNANAIAERAIHAHARPWIGLVRATLKPLNDGLPAEIAVEVENFGQSPALRVRSGISCSLIAPNHAPPDPGVAKHCATLFPGTQMKLAPDIGKSTPLPPGSVAAIQAGAVVFWAVVQLFYEDGLGEHETLMQLRYNPKTGLFGGAEGGDRIT